MKTICLDDKNIVATAELTVAEVCEFLKRLNELNIRDLTEVKIKFGPYYYRESDQSIVFITLYEENEIMRDLLRRSFKDGLLCHWEWNKKFSINTIA